jgi:hypothetical protein
MKESGFPDSFICFHLLTFSPTHILPIKGDLLLLLAGAISKCSIAYELYLDCFVRIRCTRPTR